MAGFASGRLRCFHPAIFAERETIVNFLTIRGTLPLATALEAVV
jgi:hypothetical protein